MASKVILKKSSVAGRVPTASDLDYGELALNYADGKIYYKNSSNSIAEISGGSGGSLGTLTVRRNYEFVATAGQTTFVVPDGYVVGNIDVIVNGSFLANSDFTATNGTSVVLAEGAVVDDLVHITVFESEDSYTKIESDAITTNLTNHAIAMAIALG